LHPVWRGVYAVGRPELTRRGLWMAAVLACGPGAALSWLRYHRTPAQQARDRVRDQAHAAAGLVSLRFTRAQVRFEPEHVRVTLAEVARRLRSR
jgi:hypothetical protein